MIGFPYPWNLDYQHAPIHIVYHTAFRLCRRHASSTSLSLVLYRGIGRSFGAPCLQNKTYPMTGLGADGGVMRGVT